jgi:hypothetical protein
VDTNFLDANYGQIILNFLNNIKNPVDGTVIATLIAGAIGALAVWLTARRSNKILKDQLEQSDKQHQVQGLLVAFRLLDSPKHRESRGKIYKLYFDFLNSNNNNVQVFSQPEAGDIMADFDVIGKLIENNNISIADFLNVYGSLAYRCWRILEIHIRRERKKRGLEKFMSNFETLAIDGYIYWDEVENHDIDTTILYNPDPTATPPSITIKEIIKNTENYFSKSK